jgi:hypothetical protein
LIVCPYYFSVIGIELVNFSLYSLDIVFTC